MPTFVIKTADRPDFTIKAYEYFLTRDNNFDFEDEESNTVASVPNASNIIAIVKDDNLFESDEDDVCLDCRFGEFLDSDDFREAVIDIVDSWHEIPDPPENEGGEESSKTEEETPPRKIELRRQKESGQESWGFVTRDGKAWVPCGGPGSASMALSLGVKDPIRTWYTWPLEETELIPEVVQ